MCPGFLLLEYYIYVFIPFCSENESKAARLARRGYDDFAGSQSEIEAPANPSKKKRVVSTFLVSFTYLIASFS